MMVTLAACGPGKHSGDGEGGSGDETGAADDSDGDGLPDDDDPFPMDPALPGIVLPNLIYAHTPDTLYTMGVDPPHDVVEIGAFAFEAGMFDTVTDLAIDRFGVLYAVTYAGLSVCNPATAQCYALATLPEAHNGLAFLPEGMLADDDDALIAVSTFGTWRHLDLHGAMVSAIDLGAYGAAYTSSGDSLSFGELGTYASVDTAMATDDVIIEVDPLTGAALGELATTTGYTSLYGMAASSGTIFAFDETGAVLGIDPDVGTVAVVRETTHTWWGAATSTVPD
jgi:hypothetical protein